MSEQEFIERIIAGDLDAMLHNLDLCIREQAAENEPDDDENDPPADKFEERDGSQLVKKPGRCVVEVAHDGVTWDV